MADAPLAAYWLRTLRRFVGDTVCVTTTQGTARKGVLTETPNGPRLFTEAGMVVVPLDRIVSVEVAT